MTHERYPNPASADEFDSQTLATVNATVGALSAIPADGDIVAVWFALQGVPAISAVQTVEIRQHNVALARTVAALSTSVPSIYLKLCDFGGIIQNGLDLVSASAVQPVGCGYLRRRKHQG